MPSTRGQHLLGKEIGDCLLEKLIGYGGSSAVFLAQPRNSTQKVAVKVFLPRSTMDVPTQKSFYRRFLREAEAASDLQHPHILSIYSYGEHEGLPYIIMPYMPGGTLSEYVKEHGPLTLREANRYLRQIAGALDYAHEQGCVHCDVKPANILLSSNGEVVLSDFGIVRLMGNATLSTRHSQHSSDTLMGTPDYISPEQALGDHLDGRSDVYSLAVSLFFLLTGCPPFKGATPIAMALMHVHEPPPLLSWSRA
ncbi:MAG TPA: serine/threonine-protein kinase, partial [Ktedonobacteraceae bacterium]|nr:serine/threonine-protein kinase [Ktedonobacteraceae bacterium]